jgi:hypothetical protein
VYRCHTVRDTARPIHRPHHPVSGVWAVNGEDRLFVCGLLEPEGRRTSIAHWSFEVTRTVIGVQILTQALSKGSPKTACCIRTPLSRVKSWPRATMQSPSRRPGIAPIPPNSHLTYSSLRKPTAEAPTAFHQLNHRIHFSAVCQESRLRFDSRGVQIYRLRQRMVERQIPCLEGAD